MSYVITQQKDGKTFYWKYGQAGGLTEDLNDARRYDRKPSADIAIARLRMHRKDQDVQFSVLEISDQEISK